MTSMAAPFASVSDLALVLFFFFHKVEALLDKGEKKRRVFSLCLAGL